MIPEKLNILIVDDTVVYRQILRQIVEEIPNTAIVDSVANGALALKRIKAKPVDLVLLDVEMPVMDGLTTLKNIRKAYPDIGVIMVSGTNENAAAVTIEALDQGAMDFVQKPDGCDPQENKKRLAGKLERLIQLFSTRNALRGLANGKPRERRVIPGARKNGRIERRSSIRIPDQRVKTKKIGSESRITLSDKGRCPDKVDIIVIGISTGGPNALAKVIPNFKKNIGVPILIVQHMPPLFTASLAESLNRKSTLDVVEAKSGDNLKPNHVYIAPGGKHMVIRKQPGGNGFMIGINENPPENNCRPSVDVLFRSVATHFGKNALALVMTGMGDDGYKGVRVLKRQGGYCLTQDIDSCVVYGMPRVVDESGLSDESVTLNDLADRATQIVEGTTL